MQLLSPPQISQPSPSMLSDLAVVKDAVNDLSQFSILYEKYATQVYRFLLVRVGNVQDAQDLTSQTFMAAMKGLKSYQGQSPFSAWLFGIARHKAADLFRQRSDLELDKADPAFDTGDNLDHFLDRQMVVEQVAVKLQNIPPARAEALSLRLFGELEVTEIARIMGRQESAVRMLIFRGLRDLRLQLNITRIVAISPTIHYNAP